MMRYRSFGEAGRVLLSVIGLGGSGYRHAGVHNESERSKKAGAGHSHALD